MTTIPNIGRGVNLRVRSGDTGEERWYGKIVKFGGKLIFHEHVRTAPKRYGVNAWGINEAVADVLTANGVEDVYLFHKPQNVTFHAELSLIRFAGLRQKSPGWGHMLNLPDSEWSKRHGEMHVPFVPSSRVCLIELAPEDTSELEISLWA